MERRGQKMTIWRIALNLTKLIALLLHGCASLPKNFERPLSHAYTDMDVLAIGPVVNNVSDSFDQDWNSELAYPALVLKGKPPTAEKIELKRQQLREFVARQHDFVYLETLRLLPLNHEKKT